MVKVDLRIIGFCALERVCISVLLGTNLSKATRQSSTSYEMMSSQEAGYLEKRDSIELTEVMVVQLHFSTTFRILRCSANFFWKVSLCCHQAQGEGWGLFSQAEKFAKAAKLCQAHSPTANVP